MTPFEDGGAQVTSGAPLLQGRVAMVTGAAVGMGAATARTLASAGAAVLVVDLDETGGRATVASITGAGGEARFFGANVAASEEVAAAVDEAVRSFGALDCAVNNAALRPDMRRIVDADDDEFAQILQVNLSSVFFCLKHEVRAMLAQGRPGSIVNIGSTRSFRAMAGSPAYVAAKHGVLGLTKTAAIEYAANGIRVNAVCPGATDTPMLSQAREVRGEEISAQAQRLTLFGRLGSPYEIANASLWLCSDLSSFVTGQSLVVDGGYLVS